MPRIYLSQPLDERLRSKIQINSGGCWVWTDSLNPKGYGQINAGGRCRLAHHVAYELWNGPVVKGNTVDHRCRNRACVNPDHLESVPHRVNLLRGKTIAAVNAAKSHCLRGHPFAGHNLITLAGGKRRCRECRDVHNRARYAKSAV